MRAVLSLSVALLLGNIRLTLTLVSLLGVLVWKWKSGLDEHLANQEILRDPTYAMYHSAVEAQGGSLYITTLVYIAVALVAGTLIVLAAKALGARKRRKDEEARQKASWQTKVASDLEVKEAAKRDEARVSAVKSADHLSKDCDCGLYKKLWGFVEGGPVQWEVHQGETEILGVLVRVEELERVFGEAESFYHETLEEMLCAAGAPHYWRAVEGDGRTYEMLDDIGILVRRPAYLSRFARRSKPKVEAN